MEISYATRYLGAEYGWLIYLVGVEALVLFLARYIRESERTIGVMILLALIANYITYFLSIALSVVFFGVSSGAMEMLGQPPILAQFAGFAQSAGLSFPAGSFLLENGMSQEAVHAVIMGWSKVYFLVYVALGMAVRWSIVALAMPKGKRLGVWKAALMAAVASYAFLFFVITSREIGLKM